MCLSLVPARNGAEFLEQGCYEAGESRLAFHMMELVSTLGGRHVEWQESEQSTPAIAHA